jgi:Domain of unknown function (DUF5074)
LFSILLILSSCKEDGNEGPTGIWKDSVFVTNEGPFQGGTGTILAYNRQTGEVSGDLFESANGRPLGNIVQSVTVGEGLAIIAVNNSNRLEIVNVEDFISVATIDSLPLPRYILIDGEKAFVSCWDNTIKVISLADYSLTDELPAGTGPDELALSGGYLYAVNSGGYGVDSTVSFVNVNDKEIFGMIEVGHRPSGIVTGKDGRLWVLCSGKGWNSYPDPSDTPGELVCIDPLTRTVVCEYPFPDASMHPDQLIVSEDGGTLYYSCPDGIYKFSLDSPGIAETPFIASGIMYYALGYDPVSDMIFASDPIDYAQNGRIYRYNATDGTAAASFSAGVIPGSFWFNN